MFSYDATNISFFHEETSYVHILFQIRNFKFKDTIKAYNSKTDYFGTIFLQVLQFEM